MKICFAVLITFFTHKILSQSDTVNHFDNKGKKHGYWIQYVDSLTSPTTRENSFYYGYEIYNHGKSIYSFLKQEMDARRKTTISFQPSKKGQPVPLTGTIWNYTVDKGKMFLRDEEKYDQGHIITIREFAKEEPDTVKIWALTDYTARYQNIAGTYKFVKYLSLFGNPDTTIYWYREHKGKWTWRKED